MRQFTQGHLTRDCHIYCTAINTIIVSLAPRSPRLEHGHLHRDTHPSPQARVVGFSIVTTMRTIPEAVVTALLLCGTSIPTGTSFSSALSTSTIPHGTGSESFRRRVPSRRMFGPPESSMLPGTAPASTAYAEGGLEGLTRSELQSMCKELNLRAVGKTSDLIDRLQQQQQQKQFRASTSSDTRDDLSTLMTDEGVASSPSPPTAPSCSRRQTAGTVPLAPSPSDEEEVPRLPPTAGEEVDSDRLPESTRGLFSELSNEQWARVEQLGQLLTEWNGRVNLISRKDIGNVMVRHVVPCLAMAKALNLENGVEGECLAYAYSTMIRSSIAFHVPPHDVLYVLILSPRVP